MQPFWCVGTAQTRLGRLADGPAHAQWTQTEPRSESRAGRPAGARDLLEHRPDWWRGLYGGGGCMQRGAP